jgi:hypothetical protein
MHGGYVGGGAPPNFLVGCLVGRCAKNFKANSRFDQIGYKPSAEPNNTSDTKAFDDLPIPVFRRHQLVLINYHAFFGCFFSIQKILITYFGA